MKLTVALSLFLLGLLAMVTDITVALCCPETYQLYMASELGVIENLQVLALVSALLLNLWLLATRKYPLLVKVWLGVFALGLVFVLGEEISWGQHYMGWEAEGWFAARNDQSETNLHNTSSWLDQKPRALLLISLYLGGIIAPLWEAKRGTRIFNLPQWFMPVLANVPLAVLVFLAGVPKYVNKLGIEGVSLDIHGLRFSEMQELLLYIYFVAYLVDLAKALKVSRTK
ncbi:MAG: hypothetical protein DI628_03725 [Blastochloris viridis]|uniref:Uncharacterized protein n=1 Tax=Blastochloris viridis TaxID=1079 RepID=A0A6N4RCL0_BLAVI|nr:MAG: hypothetical protein DI628_03725 [Blastochloris viridis]